jgi:hypothetical protein
MGAISDFEFILATLLGQGNDTPLRNALLRSCTTDVPRIMAFAIVTSTDSSSLMTCPERSSSKSWIRGP